jgi:hypothetical protein
MGLGRLIDSFEKNEKKGEERGEEGQKKGEEREKKGARLELHQLRHERENKGDEPL